MNLTDMAAEYSLETVMKKMKAGSSPKGRLAFLPTPKGREYFGSWEGGSRKSVDSKFTSLSAKPSTAWWNTRGKARLCSKRAMADATPLGEEPAKIVA